MYVWPNGCLQKSNRILFLEQFFFCPYCVYQLLPNALLPPTNLFTTIQLATAEALPPGDRSPALAALCLPSGPDESVPALTYAPLTHAVAVSLLFIPRESSERQDHPKALKSAWWEDWVDGRAEGWLYFGKQWQVDWSLLSASWDGELRGRGTVKYVML